MTTKNHRVAAGPGRRTQSTTGETMKMRNVRMLDEHWDKASAIGAARGVSASEVFRMLIDEAPMPKRGAR